MTHILLRGLTKSFGEGEERITALHEVSFGIGESEYLAVLGPGGSGKTTLLRLIAGDLAPDAGSVVIDSNVVSPHGKTVPAVEHGVGMIFQNLALWPHRTIFENIMFGLQVRNVPADEAEGRVQQVLALMKMAGMGGRYPKHLSAAQRLRAALARSLVVAPKILLLDEPLGEVDVKSRERMRAELRRLQRELRIPFVHATQDSSEALALSDRIAVLDAGRLQQLGTPQEIYSQPANRTVAHLMGFANVLSGHVREIRAGIARMDAGPDFRLEIPAREGIAIGDHLEVIVRPENIRLSRLEPPVVNGAPARISDATFLGNITEYYATLPSGRGIRVQAHPIQRFAVGDNVSVEIDVGRCGLLRLQAGRSPAAP